MLTHALRCALAGATGAEAEKMWKDMEDLLQDDPATPFAGAFAFALRERPAPVPQMQRILEVLDTHPVCSVRASALPLREAAAGDASARAQAALRSPCWRLQAAALAVLRRLEIAPDPGAHLPSILEPRPAMEPVSTGTAR